MDMVRKILNANMTKTQRYVIWLKGFLDACDKNWLIAGP